MAVLFYLDFTLAVGGDNAAPTDIVGESLSAPVSAQHKKFSSTHFQSHPNSNLC
ncbi:hypothetical protein J2125_003072 [Erwinia toletana]|uniref:Uncharacterized protein n=1 Tax=Winslowiella toletana TaxID=92490 RepID=A0ABS4PB54_9GAMM|nr:hypothetical protein [Winslowiella toletana]